MTTTKDPRLFHSEGPEFYAAYNTMLALEKRWIPTVSAEGRRGSHPYVPYPYGKFAVGMRNCRMYFAQKDARRIEPRKFLDLGCGIGTKVLLAAEMGWAADGLDFVPEYCSAARELLEGQSSQVFNDDAFKFRDYSRYDVIYAYRPIVSDEGMARLTSIVCDNTAPGTLLFFPTYDCNNDKLAEWGDHIWERVDIRE